MNNRFGRVCLLLGSCLSASATAQETRPITLVAAAQDGAISAYIDCQRCPSDYQQFFRTEITYVDFVRERQQADVHVLITTERTGSGGAAWSLAFLGQGAFAGVDDTLKFATPPASSEDQTRRMMTSILRLGFVPYIARTGQAEKLTVTFAGAPKAREEEKKDRWNSWVFSARADGFANGEESRRFLNVFGNVGADRVTQRWKITTGLNVSSSESQFTLSDGVVRSKRNSRGASATVVRSLGEHWSAGGFASMSGSSFSNIAFGWALSPAIEFDVFPYSDSTRRQLRFLYRAGPRFARYDQVTIFDKTRETLGQQSLGVTLDQKTKWGSTRISVEAQSHVHDLGSNSISVSGDLNWRLVRGLSVRTSGNYSRVRDQRSLPRVTATDEEILLQISQLRSGYNYFVSFGFSYSFGATTNNVVNPRFGR
ncbi:MAG: hypothetical protein ABIR28_13730 [Vicinamibacteria bacterium]